MFYYRIKYVGNKDIEIYNNLSYKRRILWISWYRK
nr:MAG TPA: hypothetical protein [Caudoviricetes sp.]